MRITRPQLTISILIAGIFSGAALAGDAVLIPASAVTYSVKAPEEVRTETIPAASLNPPLATPSATPALDQPSIISIEPAPTTATPLLKAAESLGDPQRDLWARIRVGFALSELDSALVQENEAWYAKRPDYVERMLDRSKRYMFYIVEEVEKRGMPTEIALLPMIESAFNPKAYSRSHAAGIWQFIPSTGRHFGLSQNWWVDSRRDVIAATDAALDYLQKLHNMFGSWELALAAYNWGEGSVSRAIAKNKARGEPTDYLSLRMPNETRQYVPRLMAIKNLIAAPSNFGLDLGVVPNQPYFAQITLTQHIDVALAAKLSDTTLDEFTSLNPHYNRPVIQAKQPVTLLLPVDKAEVFASNLENYGKPLVSWQPYHAKRGEKLDAIASRHGISSARLKDANGINLKRGHLASNQVLLVPGTSGVKLETAAFSEIKTESLALANGRVYSVRKGDTLLSIAKRHGVKAEQIKAWSNLKSNRLARNQKLNVGPVEKAALSDTVVSSKVAAKASQRVSAKKAPANKQYTVRRGDTLYSIAQRFAVELDDLLRWNKLSSKKRIKPGDKVTIVLATNG
ncbi:MAG: LysM peptidoglycan-binding domain-containing protein [Burkholderiales bacterium]|nr:LysM peptidoglycan-binding domain-containing protein [Burkholderiales bacterium]